MTALDRRVGIGDDQRVDRQHAEQPLLAVDDEQLVGLRRQLVEAAQVAQHDLERDVGPHRDVLEIHQRADHVVVEGHRGAQLLALLDRQALEHIVHHLLREVRARARRSRRPRGSRSRRRAPRCPSTRSATRGPRRRPRAGCRRRARRGPGPRCRAARRAAAPRGCRRCRRDAAGRARAAAPPCSSCRRRSRRARRRSARRVARPARWTSPSTSRCLRSSAVTSASASCTLARASGRTLVGVLEGFGHGAVGRRANGRAQSSRPCDGGQVTIRARRARLNRPTCRTRRPTDRIRESSPPASARGSSRRGRRDRPSPACARTRAGWASSPRAAPPAPAESCAAGTPK